MNQDLLGVLCCPVTHKSLETIAERDLGALNRAIRAGTLTNRAGDTLDSPFADGLVTVDGRVFYPIQDGIPVLLEAESVLLAQLDGA